MRLFNQNQKHYFISKMMDKGLNKRLAETACYVANGLSYKEICEILGITVSALKQRINGNPSAYYPGLLKKLNIDTPQQIILTLTEKEIVTLSKMGPPLV